VRRSLNLNWIISFEASARLLSFTKAAQELSLTQAGVSQHIRMLEQELGEPLFLRLPRAVRLTDAGEAYLHVVRGSLEQLRLGTSDIFGPGSEGVVRLRADPAFVDYWLAPRLKDFLDAYPDISVQLSAILHGVDTVWDAVDMEVRYNSDRIGGMDAIALMGDAVFPVCQPGLGRRLRQPSDLLHQRLLHVTGNRRGWTDWLAAAGIALTAKTALLQTDSPSTSLVLAEQGAGVALGHASLVAPLLQQERLIRPFAPELETVGIFYLITPRDHPLRRQARLFRDWLLVEGTHTSTETLEHAGAG
jgi:LysR family transcriptional regulator, glycine cleavage system transcriptional activator